MIKTESIRYTAGGTTLHGHLAWDDEKQGPLPAVLVVHEWWGAGDYVKKRAEMLAEEGFVGFAIDLFGEGFVTEEASEANERMNDALSDLDRLTGRFEAAVAAVTARPEVDGAKVSALGYCFGGAVVLAMARKGLDLKAVVAYHPGSLDLGAPSPKGKVTAKVLACVGADDPMVAPERHGAFRDDLSAADVDGELVVYPGVVHGFTNPGATARGERFGLPLRYDEPADRDSWKRTLDLLASVS